MKKKEKEWEQEKKFFLKFEEPLSEKVLSDLSIGEKKFAEYKSWSTIKLGDKVVGLIAEDALDINYTIIRDLIMATSRKADDETIIKNLKPLANRIIESFKLKKDSYEITEGDEYTSLENTSLGSWFKDTEFFKKIESEFGEEQTSLIQIRFVIRNTEGDEIVTLGYDSQKDFDKKLLTVGANKKYLPRIIKAIGKNVV